MAWQIELSATAGKFLAKLDRTAAKRITTFLRERIAPSDGPGSTGKALTDRLAGLWRDRVGDYRLICEIVDRKLRVLVLTIGHRGDVIASLT